MPGAQARSSRPARSPGVLVAAPWWVLALGATYVSYLAMVLSFEVRAPRIAWTVGPTTDSVIVAEVAPGSAASAAGLLPGDRLTEVAGRRVADGLDWGVAAAHFPADGPADVTLERQGRTIRTTVSPAASAGERVSRSMLLLLVSVRIPAMAMALLLLWRRPADRHARLGALCLATLATAVDVPHESMAAAWRGLPRLVATAFWIPYGVGLAFGGPILVTFASSFPRPVLRRWWARAAVFLPACAVLVWYLPVVIRATRDGRTGVGDLQRVIQVGPPVNVAYLLGALVALFVGYRRLVDANDRRRVRVLVAGSAVGVLAPLPFQVALALAPSAAFARSWLAHAGSLFAAFVPLSFAYAVLRHRLFDVRLVVRSGVRYALARRTLLAVVPVLLGLLAVDLVWHGDEPLLSVLGRRGVLYGGLAAVALLARAHRDRWLDALDRHFFRERYDALLLLREVTYDVARGASFSEAADRAVTAIESAVHPEFATVVLEGPVSGRVVSVATAPAGNAALSWPADSRFLGVVRALGSPLQVKSTEAAALIEGLPDADVERLDQDGVDLVVPIPVGGRHAALVLGTKRSEEPWDREERDLLQSVAVALGGLARAERSAEAITAIRPRALADRYRLGRRLGSGGMGVVYEAADEQLDRRVAVKVVREDRAADAAAERRFRREARALAAFSHPNVVTIHDFGVAADGRAFLVMEFLEGPTLRRTLKEGGPLPASRALGILDGVVAAVDAAHRRRIVHRDLKPENVILAHGETGEVPKVLDFGLARLLAGEGAAPGETGTRAIAGTPGYMGPEQLSGGVVEPSWDMWALSVIAYEMLTGAHPFFGRDPRSAGGQVRPCPSATAPLAGFFTLAFAPEAVRRPASAVRWLAALRQSLEAL